MNARVSIVVLCLALGCRRTPPPGSGAVETTGAVPSKALDDLARTKTLVGYPGGAVLTVDATSCTVGMIDPTAGAVWQRTLPQCEGVVEAAIAPDSMAYARTPTGLMAIATDGKERWRLAVGTEPLPKVLLAPAVTPDSLVVVASSLRMVMAFKAAGVQAWRFAVADDERFVSAPVGSKSEGVLLLTNRAVYNVASDGTLRWRKPIETKAPG